MKLIKDRIVVILDKNFSIIRYVLEKVMLRYSVKFGFEQAHYALISS